MAMLQNRRKKGVTPQEVISSIAGVRSTLFGAWSKRERTDWITCRRARQHLLDASLRRFPPSHLPLYTCGLPRMSTTPNCKLYAIWELTSLSCRRGGAVTVCPPSRSFPPPVPIASFMQVVIDACDMRLYIYASNERVLAAGRTGTRHRTVVGSGRVWPD
jgi:hypothetical protein